MSIDEKAFDYVKGFWSKVDIRGKDECWQWTSYCEEGYGFYRFRGKKSRTHRLAYDLTKGPIPKGMCVCHSCDNRKCCNPNHLWTGTRGQNNSDCRNKGRNTPLPHPKGEYHHNSKMTWHKVKEVREIGDTLPRKLLAARYSVSTSAIRDILTHNTWRTK